MTTLCPTCNNTLDRKHVDALKEEVLHCRVCCRFSVDGSATWLQVPVIEDLRRLIRQRDDDKARHQFMMESPIEHPMWTRIYL